MTQLTAKLLIDSHGSSPRIVTFRGKARHKIGDGHREVGHVRNR